MRIIEYELCAARTTPSPRSHCSALFIFCLSLSVYREYRFCVYTPGRAVITAPSPRPLYTLASEEPALPRVSFVPAAVSGCHGNHTRNAHPPSQTPDETGRDVGALSPQIFLQASPLSRFLRGEARRGESCPFRVGWITQICLRRTERKIIIRNSSNTNFTDKSVSVSAHKSSFVK